MDAIILAAGKGTRMRPLTNSTPKPLLKVQGRPILEWTLLGLSGIADRAIVVAKYLSEQVEEYMAQQRMFSDYAVVEQMPEPLGTGHALQVCQPFLKSDDFIVMNGDDIYDARSLQRMAGEKAAILAVERDDASKWGVIVTNEVGEVIRLHEKPEEGLYPAPVKVNIGAYKLSQKVFDYTLQKSSRGEYEITDYISLLAKDMPIKVIVAEFWQSVGNPEDLEFAQTLDMTSIQKKK